ncbi:MAG: DUF350 domain-containing protein [Pseudomonadota bacterium]
MRNATLSGLALMASSTAVQAAGDLTADALLAGIVSTVIYSLLGIGMAMLGFKMIDWMTPGNLREQIAEHENRALGTVVGATILGICIIIAAVLVS